MRQCALSDGFCRQLERIRNYKEKVSERTLQMNETQTFEQPYVFGLDIGTRNVVGTVGYKEGNEFIVVAQYVMQHETRAMIDGQIHDIGRVGKVIQTVKEELEKQIECPLTEVCIAAAGRVLKTVTTNVEYEYGRDRCYEGRYPYTGSAWN